MKSLRTFLSGNALVWAVFCALLGLFAGLNPWSRELDFKGLDLNFQVHRQAGPRPPQGPEIVIVGIDEASARGIAEPLALYHRPLGRFLEAMAEAQPAAVGVDIILPERSWDAFTPGLDAALMRGLLTLKWNAPLILGRTEIQGLPRPIHAPFETAAGLEHIGFVQCARDSDRVLRRFETRLGDQGGIVPTFAALILRALGRETKPGLINFNLGAAYDYIPFQQVLQWQAPALKKAFAGKVVLLGTVIPYEDRVPLPVHLAGWEHASTLDSPGVLLQAQILRTQCSGAVIKEFPKWFLGCLAGLAALLGMWLARNPWQRLAPLALIHIALLGAAYGLLSLDTFLPFIGILLALDMAYLLSARRAARLLVEAEEKERRLLERALLDTTERERRSIGHELHDGVCQQISGALLRYHVAERSLQEREAPELVHLRVMASLLDTSLDETHRLAMGLSPSDLVPGSLGSALEALARSTREAHEVICEFQEDGSTLELDGPVTTQLYRITQEAVANALKHGHPEEIRISLRKERARLLLRVENDGRAQSSGEAPTQAGGMGQRIMRYRAELIQGTLDLKPLEGGGFALICSIPCRQLIGEPRHD